MGLFGNRGGGFLSDGGGFLNDGRPRDIYDYRRSNTRVSVGKMLGTIFSDVETEGKKRGYEKAAKEYADAYRKIEKEYNETKISIEGQKNTYGNQAFRLIDQLEKLERQKRELEKQVNSTVNSVSRRHNIPASDVRKSLNAGTLLVGDSAEHILEIVYYFKEKKLRQAEQRGYAEAKELYEGKIQKLKDELSRLKEKGDSEIKNLLNQISQILDAIAEEEMKIAELKILL